MVAAVIIATWGTATPVLIAAGVLAGAASAAVNTALYGGDWATNILLGAAFGGIGGAVGGPLWGAMGGVQGAGLTLANFVATAAAIMGAAFGGISAAINGGNIIEGMAGGAISGAIVAAAVYGGYKAWQSLQPELAGGHVPKTPRGEWQGDPPDLDWPTDGPPRGEDRAGDGAWNAPRRHQGFAYKHDGFDAAGTRIIRPPIPGTRGQPTSGQGYESGLAYTHSSGQYRALAIHVDPTTGGILTPSNPLMTPHAHIMLQQLQGGRWVTVDPTPYLGPQP